MDEFLSRVVERTKKIRVGDPMNPDTQMGALISEEHLHKVLDYVELGKKEVRPIRKRNDVILVFMACVFHEFFPRYSFQHCELFPFARVSG